MSSKNYNDNYNDNDQQYIRFDRLNQFKDSDFISDGYLALTVDHLCSSVPIALHHHDYYELEYISEGEGVQIINDRAFIVSKGDIVFFGLSDTHTYYTIRGMEVVNCCFSQEASPEISLMDSDLNASAVLRLSPGSQKEFEDLIGLLRYEFKEKREYFKEATSCFLSLIIIFLKRHGYMKTGSDTRWSDFLIYLSKNYKTITLSAAARQMYVTKNYFCTLFKRRFGKTFISYLEDIRLETAKKLLLETDMPIKDIWENAGFSQAKRFYYLIRENTGVTPAKFRKENGNIRE